MSITRTIGKNTLGDNNKMKVNMRTYNRSTHDMSYVWRNTQAVGTLVPFMCEVALPGDTHEIKLEAHVMTHPTVGPLFGSFKLQMDVFSCPFRLYNAQLHNNTLGIGLDIKSVKLPQLALWINDTQDWPTNTNEFTQINPSCLLAYLGLKGYGCVELGDEQQRIKRNAVPLLSYWDIFKNYYANKQEEYAYYISDGIFINEVTWFSSGRGTTFNRGINLYIPINPNDVINVFPKLPIDSKIYVRLYKSGQPQNIVTVRAGEIGDIINTDNDITSIKFNTKYEGWVLIDIWHGSSEVTLDKFKLTNLDDMREKILKAPKNTEFEISSATVETPYKVFMERNSNNNLKTSSKQFGLAVKTYNSDIMQNWINTEWIDGENGINAISAVDVSDGKFTMDALNLAGKVYDMLNRIAISGGSYSDWIETVFTNEFHMNTETPVYEGGASQEIVFQEVISNAATIGEPLGSLAGRGKLSGRQKGGFIKVRTKEPAYLMGIVSITPRIDYSQGNRFDSLFRTLDDLHKPALDGIGYQDLITDKMAWWSTRAFNDSYVFRTVGKQPAWLDYMTNYNRTYGAFADRFDEAFMVLNRNYERAGGGEDSYMTDLTTYIDPAKFNYIFADTKLDAMNFWVQIAVEIKARRMISAKSIPNL